VRYVLFREDSQHTGIYAGSAGPLRGDLETPGEGEKRDGNRASHLVHRKNDVGGVGRTRKRGTLMAWAYTEAGNEISCPSSEAGFSVNGPLTVEDWKKILDYIVEEIVEQAKREAREGAER
jgi:hypothetical protein